MDGFAWYVWGSQWWHWYLLSAASVFLGLDSRTIFGRLMATIMAVFAAWIGARLMVA